VRVRRFELRLLAAVLTAAWAAAAALVIAGYRPGGPIDVLVGIAALPAALVAALALVWPPVARGDRPFWAIGGLGVAALLLLLPSIAGLVGQLQAGGPQTLLPSLEASYPWLLALGATALFTGLGIARRVLGGTAVRRRRLLLGIAIASGLTLAIGGGFAGVAIANDLALRDRPALDSPFGPTDPSLTPPACDGAIAAGAAAHVGLVLSGQVDLGSIGDVRLQGVRSGSDSSWTADVATSTVLGTFGAARVGSRGWTFDTAGGWTQADPAALGAGTLDLLVVETALTRGNRVAAESLGIDFVEGARARHCRIAVDGETFRAAFPQVAWLVGDDPMSRWRGDLDYWVFGDGEVGQVVGSISGEGASLTPKGIQGTVRVTMTATDRDRTVGVPAPSR
jgi:hypothetical protein